MKKSKLLVGAVILTTGILLSGCTKSKAEKFDKSDSPFRFVKDCGYLSTDGSGFDVYEVEDENTGTHYYLLDGYESVALTPIMDSSLIQKTEDKKDSNKELEEINNKIKDLEKQKEQIENNKEEE